MSARHLFVQFFSLLCLIGAVCGLGVCLYKSAGTQGYVIATVAQTYYAQAQQPGVSPESAAYLRALARQTTLQAIAYDPHNAAHWEFLAAVLESESDFAAARTARSFAAQLGGTNPEKPGKQASLPDHSAAAKDLRVMAARTVGTE